MTRIDGVLLPSINRNSGLNNVTNLQPPTEVIVLDSESESSPPLRSCMNYINKIISYNS